jgi:hypothetical protein
MDSEFSEFSYGFAVTAELADALRPLKVAPILPSLLAEAKGGWDLKLETEKGVVVFVQFKIPFACTRRSALEWGLYGSTYYRLYIRRRNHSRQHNRLKRLSLHQPLVYYVAPRFYDLTTFNERYLHSRVLAESAQFPLTDLPVLTDNKQHYICYQNGSSGYWCSEEPVEIKAETPDVLIRSFAAAVLERPIEFDKQHLLTVRSDLLSSIEEPTLPVGQPDIRGFDDVVRDIVYVSRTYFNAEPIFLTLASGPHLR